MMFLTQYNGAFLGPIAKVLGVILEYLAEFLNMFGIVNVGVTIILFTFVVNALMIPLTIKQQKFSKLQSRMAPELAKITKKYKGKRDEASMRKQQMETSAVYQKYGSSPTGGCLPLLITMPILFALYRVIYHIPAYVQLYYDMYEPLAKGIIEIGDFTNRLGNWKDISTAASQLQEPINNWTNLAASNPEVLQNNVVELLSQFTTSNWDALTKIYPQLADTIATTSEQISHANSIGFGLSVVNPSGWGFPGIIIPVMAAGFQFLQTKMMMTTPMDEENPAASTMKVMNNVMPIMSGVMCAVLPVGVGLYWIAGSVFRVIQQFFVNRYMDTIDVDKLIEKNVEKRNKKLEKKGIDPKKLEEISRTRTSTISDQKASAKKSVSQKAKAAPSDYKRAEGNFKEGSIAAKANLLNRKNEEKGDK